MALDDVDLQKVIAAWERLPEEIRKTIRVLVNAKQAQDGV